MPEEASQLNSERIAQQQEVVDTIKGKAEKGWNSGKGVFTLTVGEILFMADKFGRDISDEERAKLEQKDGYMVMLKAGSYKKLSMERANRDLGAMLKSAEAVINSTEQKPI